MAAEDNFDVEQEMEKIRLEEEEIEKRKNALEEKKKTLRARSGFMDDIKKAEELRLTTDDDIERSSTDIKGFMDDLRKRKELRLTTGGDIKRSPTDNEGFMDDIKKVKEIRITTDQDIECSSTDNEELRAIVVGKTGNGKSSVINTLAGKKILVAIPSQKSITKKCKLANVKLGNTLLLAVDTPGLYDTDLKHEDTLKEIGKAMGMTSPGFHAFIIVMRIGRFTDEEKHTVEMLAKEFGPQFYNRALILFTSLDDLEADGLSFDQYIKDYIHDDLSDIIRRCNQRTVGFNNRAEGEARKIQIEKLLKLLTDILKSNNDTYYTNETYKEAEEKIEEERQKQLKEDKTKSRKQVTKGIREDIEEEKGFGKKFLSWFRQSSCVIS